MKEILNKYGLLGYKELWGLEFPISLYLQLLNVLGDDKEKWVLLDGRKIHTLEEFYKQVQNQMTKELDFQIGHNMNAFNDILWGGFGVHDYEEPLHIVWIYADESRLYLEKEDF